MIDKSGSWQKSGLRFGLTKLAEGLERQSDIILPLETAPSNDKELHEYVYYTWGIWIPRNKICQNHVAPFEAFADAYFARSLRALWIGSRGLAGKTLMLAALSLTEACTFGVGVSLLGGSGEQSARVHKYLDGSAMPGCFWDSPHAPKHLLESDPTKRETKLRNGGWMIALMASSKSVRGPHPVRLRVDELDEVDEEIWESAHGQPMASRGVDDHILASSTHHYPFGLVTKEIAECRNRGFPKFEWCYKESMGDAPPGKKSWLLPRQVERKKESVSQRTWDTEYELQEPNVPGAKVYPGFDKNLNVKPVPDIGLPIVIGMDFNVNPMSATINYIFRGKLLQFDEIEIYNSNTIDMCLTIMGRYCVDSIVTLEGKKRIVPRIERYDTNPETGEKIGYIKRYRLPSEITVYPDASGKTRSASSGGSTSFSIIESFGFNIQAPNANPPVRDRIDETSAMICNAARDRRWLINPRCVRTIMCVSQLPFKDGTSVPDKDLGLDHMPDAQGYLIHMEFPLVSNELEEIEIGGL